MKKIGLWLIMAVMLLLTGCKGKENVVQQNMGRYVETILPLPEDESVISIVEEDGQFVLFTKKYDNDIFEMKKYRLQDNVWVEEKADWLAKTLEFIRGTSTPDGELIKIVYGEDHNYYAIMNAYGEKESRDFLFRSKDGAADCEEIKIPLLDEACYTDTDYVLYNCIADIRVCADGTLFLNVNGEPYSIFSGEGEKLGDTEVKGSYEARGEIWNAFAKENTLIGIGKGRDELIVWNSSTNSKEKTIPLGQKKQSGSIYQMEDGTLIYVDENGIQIQSGNGTMWETIADGGLNSMSLPNIMVKGLFARPQGEGEIGNTYYILYAGDNGDNKFVQYSFDPDIVAVPDKTLRVYSIYDNSTIRQAISEFQKEHQDVRVEYTVAVRYGNEKLEECIKGLNTELASGKGADVLVLDELPFESYLKKGIFLDISEECKNSGMLENISEAYNQAGKVYYIPTRLAIPIVMGNDDALKTTGSLSEIVQYAKSHPELPWSKDSEVQCLFYELLCMEQNQFVTEDNKLNREEFEEFLNNLSYFKENQCCFYDEKRDGFQGFWSSPYYLKEGKVHAAFDSVSNMGSMFVAALMQKQGIGYSSMEGGFKSNGLLGVNASGEQPELAKEFVATVLGEKVQSVDTADGLPVNKKAWEKLVEKDEDLYLSSGYMLEDGTHATVSGEYPKHEQRQKFYEFVMTLTKPIETATKKTNLIWEELSRFARDEIGMEETLTNVESKLNRYLSEQEEY